jgi:hypothetical protein
MKRKKKKENQEMCLDFFHCMTLKRISKRQEKKRRKSFSRVF